MLTLGSLPNFSAKDLVQPHLAIEVIKQVNSQIPVHLFIQRCRLRCQKLMSPDNTLLFLLVFLEQFTSPGGCIDLRFKKPWLKSPTCSTAEASKYCGDEEQVNNCMGKGEQPLLTK